MVFIQNKKWTSILVVCQLITQLDCQMYAPVYAPPIYAMPPPPPLQIAVAVPIPVEIKTKKTTTTTTTEKPNIAFAVPVPVPVAVAVAVARPPPPPPPPPCGAVRPPCGPILIPGPSYGVPVPVPQPIIVPYPRPPDMRTILGHFSRKKPGKRRPVSESSDSSSTSDSSSDWSAVKRQYKKNKGIGRKGKKKKKSHRGNRRMNKEFNSDDSRSDFVPNPVLRYVAKNGDIKIERRLSHASALDLLNKESKVPRVRKEMSDESDISADSKQKPKGVGSPYIRHLSEGKKEIIFNPPSHKKIANLSMSFRIV